MTKEGIKDFLTTEAEYTEEQVNNMSDYELIDVYLRWEGLINWTSEIVEMMESFTGVEISTIKED